MKAEAIRGVRFRGNVRLGQIRPGATSNWFNASWQFRKQITINQASTTLSNFPVLINLSDDQLKTYALSSGEDILFTDSNKVKLSHEIEKFDKTTGELWAWVEIPTLSSTANTPIYMYYAGYGNQQDRINVWDSNYMGVWHLAEDPSISTDGHCGGKTTELCDATANGNDGDNAANLLSTDQRAGQINGSIDFRGGVSEWIKTQNENSVKTSTQTTLSLWFKTDTLDSTERSLYEEERNGGTTKRFRLRIDTDNKLIFSGRAPDTDAETTWINSNVTLSTASWYYVTAVFDSDTDTHYLRVNGNTETSSVVEAGFSSGNPNRVPSIGAASGGGLRFDGQIDEVRISNIARSADWSAIEYDNQSATSSFYSIGSAEFRRPKVRLR